MCLFQLIMFGLNNQLVVSYKEDNRMALKNLFLMDYSGADEDDYSTAVYTQQGVYDALFYVLDQASILIRSLLLLALLCHLCEPSFVTLFWINIFKKNEMIKLCYACDFFIPGRESMVQQKHTSNRVHKSATLAIPPGSGFLARG